MAFLRGSTAGSPLADAVFALGTELDFDLIAERMEQPRQLARLKKLKCRLGQGYLLARPMPAERVGELIRRRRIEPNWDTEEGVGSRIARRRTQHAL